MLNRAGNAAGDVQVRGNDLAGLSDLILLRAPAGVHRRAGRADRAFEHIRQLFEDGVAFGALHAAAAGDDHVGFRQIDLAAGVFLHFQHFALGSVNGDIDLGHGAGFGVFSRREHIGTKRCHGRSAVEHHFAEALAGVHRADGHQVAAVNLHIRAVRRQTAGQFCGHAGGKILALHRRAEQNDRRIVVLDDFGGRGGVRFRHIGLQRRVIADKYFIDAVLAQFGGQSFYSCSKQNGADFIAALVGQLAGR